MENPGYSPEKLKKNKKIFFVEKPFLSRFGGFIEIFINKPFLEI
jgi:hypothetical protein